MFWFILTYDYPKTRKVSKEELTRFIRSHYPDTNDVQQARHLGAQAGWWIVAGGRDNIVNVKSAIEAIEIGGFMMTKDEL